MNKNHDNNIKHKKGVHPAFHMNGHGYPSTLKKLVIAFLAIDFFTLLVSLLAFAFTIAYLAKEGEEDYGCVNGYHPTDWLKASFAMTIISEITTIVAMLILMIIWLARKKKMTILYRFRLNRWLHLFHVFSRLALLIALLGLLSKHQHFLCYRSTGLWVIVFDAITALSIMQVIGILLWFILRLVIRCMYKAWYKPKPTQTTTVPTEIHVHERDRN